MIIKSWFANECLVTPASDRQPGTFTQVNNPTTIPNQLTISRRLFTFRVRIIWTKKKDQPKNTLSVKSSSSSWRRRKFRLTPLCLGESDITGSVLTIHFHATFSFRKCQHLKVENCSIIFFFQQVYHNFNYFQQHAASTVLVIFPP